MQWLNDWEAVTEIRLAELNREAKQTALLAQLPPTTATRWVFVRRLMGNALVWLGTRLTGWGERITARPYRQGSHIAQQVVQQIEVR